MCGEAVTVDAYLDEVPVNRRDLVAEIRGDIRYCRAEQMNRAVLRSQLEATADTRGPMC